MNNINFAAPSFAASINASMNFSTCSMGGINSIPSANTDLVSLSGRTGDCFNAGFFNPLSNLTSAFSGLGMGNIPGFGNACNPMGSMFGSMMQMINNQTQMMNMMMMLLMMMIQKQTMNGFGALANALGGGMGGFGGGMGGFGGGIPGFGGGNGIGGASPISSGPTQVGKGGQAAVDLAKRFLGQPSISIKGKLPHFTAAGGVTNNCADFVSSCLESTGRIKGHHINVKEMERSILQQGWRRVDRAHAQPGDIWMSDNRGHVELVAEAGGRRLIGSNGSSYQRVSMGQPYGNGGVFYHKE